MLWSDIERLERLVDPWREFDRMRKDLFRVATGRVEFPALNVWTSPDDAVVTTEIPGLDLKDLEISVTGNTLTIRGARREEQLNAGETYHRMERWQGDFSKIIELPFSVEADKVEARYARGILSITMPRAASEKPRKITVTT